MNVWKKSFALALPLALATAACDDAITEPDTIDDAAVRADAALVAADGMFQDLSIFQDLGLPGFGLAPAVAAPSGGSFTFTRTVTFFDAAGAEMDAFDPVGTASILVVADATGTRDMPFWNATIERHREYSVSGLEGLETERTTSGTGTEAVSRSRHPDDAVERTYDMTAAVTYDAVVHGVPRAEFPYPLAGTITRQVHVLVKEGDAVLGQRDVTVVITFDGSQYATVDADGDTWTVDLSTQGVTRRFGKKNR